MTVGTLIEQLKAYPPELRVQFPGPAAGPSEYYDVERVDLIDEAGHPVLLIGD